MRAIEGVIVLAFTVDIAVHQIEGQIRRCLRGFFAMDSQNELIPGIARLEMLRRADRCTTS